MYNMTRQAGAGVYQSEVGACQKEEECTGVRQSEEASSSGSTNQRRTRGVYSCILEESRPKSSAI